MEEKRLHQRVPLGLEVTIIDAEGNSSSGVARDISLGGMFIQSSARFGFGQNLRIVIKFAGIKANSELPAVVRWHDGNGYGVQFGLLGARDTHQIAQLMKKQG